MILDTIFALLISVSFILLAFALTGRS